MGTLKDAGHKSSDKTTKFLHFFIRLLSVIYERQININASQTMERLFVKHR